MRRLLALLCLACWLLSTVPACSAADDVTAADIERAMSLSYYDLFAIDPAATAKDIKKAYRTVALRYHPDKFGDESSKALVHELFLRVNLAAEVLSDATLRSQYDELLADGVVDYSDHAYRMLQRARDERQYGAYRAYAMRAARGDIEWAELLVMGVTCACAVGPLCRWWWMERRRRMKAKEKAKEGIKKSKQDVELRLREQSKREEERERRRAAPLREDSDEDEAVEGESEEKRREKELRRSRAKKTRTAVRALMKPYSTDEDEEKDGEGRRADGTLGSEEVELVVRELALDELEQLLIGLEAVHSAEHGDEQRRRRSVALFTAALGPLTVLRQQQAEREQQRLAAQPVASSALASMKTTSTSSSSTSWPAYEVSALARAMAKHPGGSLNRWERITAIVNAANDTAGAGRTRTIKEVLARVKFDELKATMSGGEERAFEAYLEKMKKPALPLAAAALTAGGAEGPMAEAAGKERRGEEWSGTEQAALEFALRSVSRDAEDRWDQIASIVVTKSKRQCVARFKEIRAQIVASKG